MTENQVELKTSKKSKGNQIAIILAVILLCVLLVPPIWKKINQPQASKNEVLEQSESLQDKNNLTFATEKASISTIVEKVAPSVVSIATKSEVESLFGAIAQSGAGTGIILSKDGYVLTNKHVVQSSNSTTIVTSDGRTHSDVKLVGTDPLNDLAFLKINGVDDLSPIEIGTSQTLKVGQPVIAIGNALGQFQNTVTSGIISGISRNIQASGGLGTQASVLTDLIQTDAAINSGNSGGPLVNAGGQLIGINTAVTQDAQGIGFAIPIGAAKGLIKQLGVSGELKRSYLGINYISITPEVVDHYKLKVKKGAYVAETKNIDKESPAAKAGIQAGDIITQINDDMIVGDHGSLGTLTAEFAPGDKVNLTVIRGDKTKVLEVEFAAYKASAIRPSSSMIQLPLMD